MSDYISRDAFKKKYLCCGYLPEMSEKEFDEFPAADVEPVRNGRWEECDFGNETIAQAAEEKWIWRNNYGFVYENINFWSCVSGRLQR